MLISFDKIINLPLYCKDKKIENLLLERHHNDVVFLNIDETSEFIKMKKSSIYQLVYLRKIPFYKRGKLLLFKKSELVQWIESNRKKTIDELSESINMDRIVNNYKGEKMGIEKWKKN